MKARDRIERAAVAVARAQEIGRGGVQQRLLQPFGGPVLPPGGLSSSLNAAGPRGSRIGLLPVRSRASHAAKPGAGESVTKFERRGNSRETSSTTCLIRKLPKLTPAKPALAIRDRVEHRGVRALGRQRVAVHAQDRRDRARDAVGERHLDKDQRLVVQRRMEECVTAPVGRIDAAAQIVPVADLVHRLVADDLFQDDRGRRPVDAAQHQEAAIEP